MLLKQLLTPALFVHRDAQHPEIYRYIYIEVYLYVDTALATKL